MSFTIYHRALQLGLKGLVKEMIFAYVISVQGSEEYQGNISNKNHITSAKMSRPKIAAAKYIITPQKPIEQLGNKI